MRSPGTPMKSVVLRRALVGLKRWYWRWVRMRELRYQYLAAILDGTPLPPQVMPCAARHPKPEKGDLS